MLPSPRLVSVLAVAALITLITVSTEAAAQGAPDVQISFLSCSTEPEAVRVRNYGAAAASLAGYRLLSDSAGGTQNYDLGPYGPLDPGQTVTLESGPGAADDSATNTFRLTGSPLYRDNDPTDYARLVRPDASEDQVSCGETPVTPTATATATSSATATPTATTTAVPTTVTATPTTAVPTATTAVPTTATATPTTPPITTVPATTSPTRTATTAPRPPATGSGGDGGSGPANLWLGAAGALVISGALGLAAHRRRH